MHAIRYGNFIEGYAIISSMSRHSATERIKHYHNIAVAQHAFIGGHVLQGYGLRTRVFEQQEDDTLLAWGADYTPLNKWAWLGRLWAGDNYDEKIGVPGTPGGDSWLSIATKAGAATSVTMYEYSAGNVRGMKPYATVAEPHLDLPFEEVGLSHIRGGLGYWRGMPRQPQQTIEVSQLQQLATTLQTVAGYMLQLDHGA